MLLALSDILSNSSIQQIPLSLRTKAPLSRTYKVISNKDQRFMFNTEYWKISLKFTHSFTSLRILGNIRSQSHSRASSSTGIDTTRGELMNVLEQLRFACSRIPNKQNIDITSEASTRWQRQCVPPKKLFEAIWTI